MRFDGRIFTCLCFAIITTALSDDQGSISQTKDIKGKRNLKHFEVTTPFEFQRGHLYENGTRRNIGKTYQIQAFNVTYEIELKVAESENHPVIVEYFGENNDYQKKLNSNHCNKQGKITPLIDKNNQSKIESNNFAGKVAINNCEGLFGALETEEGILYIEPVEDDDTKTGSKKHVARPHIVYRDSDVDIKGGSHDSLIKEPLSFPAAAGILGLSTRGRSKRSPKKKKRRRGYNSFLQIVNRSGRRIQMYYLDHFKREISFMAFLVNERRGINTFEGTQWLARDDKTHFKLHVNGRKLFVAPRNTQYRRKELIITTPSGTVFPHTREYNDIKGGPRYLEAMLLVDASVTRFHGKDNVEKYLLTMMNIVSTIFEDNSLGVSLKFHVVRLAILDRDEPGLNIMKNPGRSLISACDFVNTLQDPNEDSKDHFDVAIIMTRRDFGPSGYAPVYSMCSRTRSCALAQDEGFTSAFIIAHETGHLLGLDHDGEGESTQCHAASNKGSIMAPVIQAQYDRFHWSKCSRDVLKENIDYFTCLNDKPIVTRIRTQNLLPGASYTLDEQCVFNFEKAFKKCNAFSYDPCQMLWCQDPTRRSYCKTMRGPALDGSACGRNKWCIQGHCVDEDNRTDNAANKPIDVQAIHGGWSEWNSWTPCSQTCGVGLRKRKRSCDSPRPKNGGRSCDGDMHLQEICSTQECMMQKPYKELRAEQCNLILKDQHWLEYEDSSFQIVLNQRWKHMNCSFEEDDLCNWSNDLQGDDFDWQIHSGKTPSQKTGPNFDHTPGKKGEGKYIYIEASDSVKSRRRKGYKARLISVTSYVPRICFRMFYHMHGQDMGILRVFVRFTNGTEFEVWKKAGNQGNEWFELEKSLEFEEYFRIVVEAIRGRHWAGDMALDDLSVVAGLCPADKKVLNPCKVSCRTRDRKQFKTNLVVTNGFRCHNNASHDICVDGQCQKFGCNNRFGSTSVIDRCGVCGGGDKSCISKKGRKKIIAKVGYQTLLILRKGSTNIKLEEVSDDNYYFGLRKTKGNGVYFSSKEQVHYTVEGCQFHFKKKDGKQVIEAKGPTRKDISVVLYAFPRSDGKQVAIKYDLFEPKPKKGVYKYSTISWGECSRTCGIGKQKAILSCVQLSDASTVDDAYCSHLVRPSFIRSCSLVNCKEYKYEISSWSRCTASCGGGERTRSIRCLNIDNNELEALKYCKPPAPAASEKCNQHTCPKEYNWRKGDWGSCSASCGGGMRRRLVRCITMDYQRTRVDDKECMEKHSKPDEQEPCNMMVCDTYIWNIELTGRCTKTCGGGEKIRLVYCVNKRTGVTVENAYCTGPSPARIVRCNTGLCPEYTWKVDIKGPCSRSCGNGTQQRDVSCVIKATDRRVDLVNCNDYDRPSPARVVSCNTQECERPPSQLPQIDLQRNLDAEYLWGYTHWSSCNALCGNGYQTRSLFCIQRATQKVVDTENCRNLPKQIKRECRRLKCANADDIGCNFDSRERPLCNWINLQNDDFDWTIGSETPSISTGPQYDHTSKEGMFAFIESSAPRAKKDRARLTSPFIRMRQGCFIIWYHMRGSTIGKLTVVLEAAHETKVIYEREGSTGDHWQKASIDLDEYENSLYGYRFTIEASVGSGVYSDIAIDDISLEENECVQRNQLPAKNKPACTERSPYCQHKNADKYCRTSPAYRTLCCRTCAAVT